jgi:endonuclease YncB( thermonuclease family)
MKYPLALLLGLCSAASDAGQSTITGSSRVIDGDTVSVNNIHVRLKGVDAAERGTPLGDDATQVMRGIVNGSELTCTLTGEHTWHREVGYCFTAAGVDINREIIAMGAALACPRYSTRYLPDEQPEAVAAQPRASYCVRHP